MKTLSDIVRIFFVAAVSCAWSSVSLRADGLSVRDGDCLSLRQCQELALENNKKMAAARKTTTRYAYTVKAYRANYFPNFKLRAADIYSNSQGHLTIDGGYLPTFSFDAAEGAMRPNVVTDAFGNVVTGPDGTPVFKEYAYFPDQKIRYKFGNVWQAGITVEQPIYMGGKISAAYRMAKIGREMAELSENLTENEVIVEVENAFAQVVRAGELGEVAKRYHALLQELLDNVQKAYKHGLKSQNDMLKVSVRLNESELKLRQAENALRLATMNLCHIIGVPLLTRLTVAEEDIMVVPDRADSLASIAGRPEFAILERKVELAGEQVKMERSDFLPNVAVAGTYSYVHGFEVNERKLFHKPGIGVLLSVAVPLFHFGEGVNKVRAARMEQERMDLEREDLEEQMSLELTQAANNLDEAFLEVALTEKSMLQAEENLRTSRREYEVGLESLVNYMEAQALWQQAYADRIDARCRLFLSGTRYRKAAGQLVPLSVGR